MSAYPGLAAFVRAVALAAWFIAAAVPMSVSAQVAAELGEKRSDLDELKRRIRDLQRELAQTEATRSGAANALAEAERAVSRMEREVRRLVAERVDAERKLALLEAELREVEQRIAARQGELSDWLRRHYMFGAADGLAPLLSTRDPNQLARDVHYLEHLGRARLSLIDSLRGDLRRKAEHALEIAARRDSVARLEAEQRVRQGELEAVHEQRRQALTEIAGQLKTQKKEVDALRADEQRLGRLIETLAQRARELAARQAARAAERQAAEARRAAEAAQSSTSSSSGGSATVTRRSEPVVGEIRQQAGPTPTGVSFSQLRGQLRFPVRGELIGRFGAQRAEGGTTWKGVFIRAASGAEVRAVSSGEVVFSDWLRGYGNLMILDHGGDYLSVYGNNDALLREVGDTVAGGETIASVGASGGGPESGLYFEIRHQGRALDPMQWVRLN